jgi:mxaJ protein
MSSRCLDAIAGCAVALLGVGPAAAAEATADALRVCADPDNLPYSNRAEQGFENGIARVVAAALGKELRYEWQPLGRGFVRKTLGAGTCDLLIGVPAGYERVLTTRPYYRSSYVFVQRADAAHKLASFDDPLLPRLTIGVQLVGDDLAATPPGHALARHGAVEHVVGYPVWGDRPAAARASADIAAGRIDAALLWGPQAGWFARRSAVPLEVSAARPPADLPLPFDFAIAMGVRKDDVALRDAVDRAIDARRGEIDAILDAYSVPLLPLGGDGSDGGAAAAAAAAAAGARR